MRVEKVLKEMNEQETEETVAGLSKEETTWDLLEKFPYRFNTVSLKNKKWIVKKSCKYCYGTGVYATVRANKIAKTPRNTVFCTCLIKLKEQKDAKKE